MGGFGALKYATRHPGVFQAAASYSGVLDAPAFAANGYANLIPDAVWGPRATDLARWREHNPLDLAANLRGLKLIELRTGNGQPGGPFGGGPGIDITELGVAAQAFTLHRRLRELRIPHVFEDYGPGHHLWAYWNRGLRQTLPAIMSRFRAVPRPPARITFTAAEPRFSAYGWSVSVRRPAMEFSRLAKAGRGGFTLSGSGSATVTTAPLFGARQALRVVVGGRAQARRADRRGRLRVRVALGPGNAVQQYTPGATTRVFTKRVRTAAR
jgi:hypothetical protein